jgi:uroporphyrinogen decarboxylase
MTRKTGGMSDAERVEALMNREKPDRVPIYPFPLGFCAMYTNGSISDTYCNPEVSLAAQRKTCQDFGWVFMPLIGYAAVGPWEFGGEIKWPAGDFAQAPTVSRHPVKTPEEAMELASPNVKDAGIVPIQMAFNKLSSQERLDSEPFNVSFYGGGAFSLAANISGVDKFSKWLLKRPDVAHHLLRLAADFEIELAQYWKDTFGTEHVLPFDWEPVSANQIISPKQFEQFALPYLRETHEKMLAMGYRTLFTHICGEQERNLPYWAQIPMGDPGFVHFGSEVDLETAAQYFPYDIILGNLDSSILQIGTPEEIYEATRKVVETGKRLPNGYVFSCSCELPPRAPIENVLAMNRAVEDFGWYE